MRFVFYTHSLISDWNHGNAHFLRGVMRELQSLGHEVRALEPGSSWSRENLLAEQGEAAIQAFHRTFPMLRSDRYGPATPHDELLRARTWWWCMNGPTLLWSLNWARCAAQGARSTLLFHDTHHRAVSAAGEIGSAGSLGL